jgi:hypothetical protein
VPVTNQRQSELNARRSAPPWSDLLCSVLWSALRISRWLKILAADVFYSMYKFSPDNFLALELCISDANKPLLLTNSEFIPYLVMGLLVDTEHGTYMARSDQTPEQRRWCQDYHCECLAQLAVFEPAREVRESNAPAFLQHSIICQYKLGTNIRKFHTHTHTHKRSRFPQVLLGDLSVMAALQAVSESGMTAEARQFAQGALLALSEKERPRAATTEGQKHVMLSCEPLYRTFNITHQTMTWSARCSIHGSFEPALVGPKSFALLPPCGVDQWDVQATIKRINESLIARGYVTWFDLTNLKGEDVFSL